MLVIKHKLIVLPAWSEPTTVLSSFKQPFVCYVLPSALSPVLIIPR